MRLLALAPGTLLQQLRLLLPSLYLLAAAADTAQGADIFRRNQTKLVSSPVRVFVKDLIMDWMNDAPPSDTDSD